MSSINQFFQETLQDSSVQQQLQLATSRESFVNTVVELGQQKGYNFTSSEAEEWLKSSAVQLQSESGDQGELNEEELDAIAGGLDKKKPPSGGSQPIDQRYKLDPPGSPGPGYITYDGKHKP